jgi:hypothetical protein
MRTILVGWIRSQSEKPGPDSHQSQCKCRIRIRIKFKIKETRKLKMEPWRAVDTHNAGVEWRVCRPMVANLHQFEEVQDPGPDPHRSEKSNLDPHHG